MAPDQPFRREVFSSIYLTMLGVIQAAAFTFLLTETLAYVQRTYIDAACCASFSDVASDLQLMRSFGTLAAVAIVTFEYAYFVTVMYRAITVRDIVTLFLLGTVEFAVASQTSVGFNWWVTNVAFAVAGVASYLNTATYKLRDVFGEDTASIKATRWHLVRATSIAVLGGAFALFVAYGLHAHIIDKVDETFATAFWVFGFGITIFLNSSIYVQQMTARK